MPLAIRLLPLLLVVAGTARAQETPVMLATLDPAAVLNATAGEWTGELQYRDYRSNSWQGLPVTVRIAGLQDGVTTVRVAEFDDGPQTGIVFITSVALVDRATNQISTAVARAGRTMEIVSETLTLPTTVVDANHWTIVATSHRMDGDSMAQVRETTVRDGATMTSLKEVNPDDDARDTWLPRNRTVLTRSPPATGAVP